MNIKDLSQKDFYRICKSLLNSKEKAGKKRKRYEIDDLIARLAKAYLEPSPLGAHCNQTQLKTTEPLILGAHNAIKNN